MERVWFQPGHGTPTPWGKADCSINATRGVVWYDTPSHGGLAVTFAWARDNLTRQAMYLAEVWSGRLWFEEDCAASLVLHEHPEFYEALGFKEDREVTEASVRRWYPQYFDADFEDQCRVAGPMPDWTTILPGDTVVLRGSDYYVTPRTATKGEKTILYRIVERNGLPFKLSLTEARSVSQIRRNGVITWERPVYSPTVALAQ